MTQNLHHYSDDFTLETTEPAGPPLPSHPRFHFLSYLTGLLTALVLVGGLTLVLRRPDPPPIVLHSPPTAVPTATPLPTATPAPIVVFVSGAVREPGMYALTPEARVGDALAAAGGMTLQANPSLVNQAERLWDGAQVHVPPMHSPSSAGVESAGETVAEIAESPVTLAKVEPPIGLSGANGAPAGRSNLGNGNTGSLIDLNLASPAALETLPGIGPSKAAAIVANRPYTTIDELERVPGIGAKTIDQLRALVTVQ